MNLENLTSELEQKNREIYMIKQKFEENEKKYSQLMNELNKENETLRNELQYTQEQDRKSVV